MRTKYSSLTIVVSCLLLVAGCSRRYPDGFPKIYPVTLQVTQEGEPLEQASIILRSADRSSTWAIGGKTDDSGIATLWTHGKYQGAPAGKFKVVVSKVVNEGEREYLDALNRKDDAAVRKIDVKSFSFVEEQYGSEETTPLEIEITPKTRTLVIEAGSPVRISRKYLK